MDYKISGKVAIVGGSSKGLGKACAVALAKEGVNIVLCARNSDELNKTKKEIEVYGVEVLALSVDMSSPEDNRRIVKETIAKFGKIDILVNNSGGPAPGSFDELSMNDFDEAYNSVLKYNIRMIKYCLPHMEESGWGRIVNIASISVKEPSPTMCYPIYLDQQSLVLPKALVATLWAKASPSTMSALATSAPTE